MISELLVVVWVKVHFLVLVVVIHVILLHNIGLLFLIVSDCRDGFKNGQPIDNVFVDQIELVQKWILGAN